MREEVLLSVGFARAELKWQNAEGYFCLFISSTWRTFCIVPITKQLKFLQDGFEDISYLAPRISSLLFLLVPSL